MASTHQPKDRRAPSRHRTDLRCLSGLAAAACCLSPAAARAESSFTPEIGLTLVGGGLAALWDASLLTVVTVNGVQARPIGTEWAVAELITGVAHAGTGAGLLIDHFQSPLGTADGALTAGLPLVFSGTWMLTHAVLSLNPEGFGVSDGHTDRTFAWTWLSTAALMGTAGLVYWGIFLDANSKLTEANQRRASGLPPRFDRAELNTHYDQSGQTAAILTGAGLLSAGLGALFFVAQDRSPPVEGSASEGGPGRSPKPGVWVEPMLSQRLTGLALVGRF